MAPMCALSQSHPQVIEAAHKALDTRGAGLSSVRFICGTQVVCHYTALVFHTHNAGSWPTQHTVRALCVCVLDVVTTCTRL